MAFVDADSTDWIANFLTISLFFSLPKHVWGEPLFIYTFILMSSGFQFGLCGRMVTLLLKSLSVPDAFQIILEVMMGQFVSSIFSSWKPKAPVIALLAFLLMADWKSFARGNQQISKTV